jgi:hypothetical protein
LGAFCDEGKSQEAEGIVSETELVREIMLNLSRKETRLFRNNVGTLQDVRGNFVKYGLAIGSSDLIGWRTITIMPKDVGNDLAVFAAVECKSPAGRVTKQQQAFIDTVIRAGGIGGVVRSLEDARRLLQI